MDLSLRRKLNKATVGFHSQFNFPLTEQELSMWQVGRLFPVNKYQKEINKSQGMYFEKGKNTLLLRRTRARYAEKKILLARTAGKFLKHLPTVKFIGITGSVAMANADSDSDIDLMFITSAGKLWTTRLLVYLVLKFFGFKLRKPQDKNEKDKLCLNLWLTEANLTWKEKNEYSAHEICQIIPIVDKDDTYTRFLASNKWIMGYWPKAVKVEKPKAKLISSRQTGFIEKLAFKLQYTYMKSKITREVVSLHRAQFHPRKIGQ